jgi:hypothetical protein
MEREYDVSKDNLSIEELLARPRLPRSPYERYKSTRAAVTATDKHVQVAANAPVVAADQAKKRAEEFEREKEDLRSFVMNRRFKDGLIPDSK